MNVLYGTVILGLTDQQALACAYVKMSASAQTLDLAHVKNIEGDGAIGLKYGLPFALNVYLCKRT